MTYSMTGYGKSSREIQHKKITVEIRTLNSKNFDLSLKFPSHYREKEAEIRNLIQQKLDRGKIDCWIFQEDINTNTTQQINEPLVASYLQQLRNLEVKYNVQTTEYLPIIFRLPEVIKNVEESMSEEFWKELMLMLNEALMRCMEFRKSEGMSLQQALQQHVKSILLLMSEVEPHEKQRTDKLRDKLRKSMLDTVPESEIDRNRFEQEIVYYLEKLDISEEKIRLKNHCDYFIETMNADGFNGRKLNFISQEMGREINTMGSKAADAEIQRIVVNMKDELEKIKEQVLNVL